MNFGMANWINLILGLPLGFYSFFDNHLRYYERKFLTLTFYAAVYLAPPDLASEILLMLVLWVCRLSLKVDRQILRWKISNNYSLFPLPALKT